MKLTTCKAIYIYLLLSFYLQRDKVGRSKGLFSYFGTRNLLTVIGF